MEVKINTYLNLIFWCFLISFHFKAEEHGVMTVIAHHQ